MQAHEGKPDALSPEDRKLLTPAEVHHILEARDAADLRPLSNPDLWEVDKLIRLFSDHPEGVRFSRVQKAMKRPEEKRKGVMKLVGKTNKKYAKAHLRYPRIGNEYHWAACWCDPKEANPLIILVWRRSSQERSRRPFTLAVDATFSARESDIRQPTTDDDDSASISKNSAARDLDRELGKARAFRAKQQNGDLLSELLHPYIRESADAWVSFNGATEDVLSMITGERLDDDSATHAMREVFIRCLPIRSWGERVGHDLVETVNFRTRSGVAQLFVFGPQDSLLETSQAIDLIHFCSSAGRATAVIVLSGYRPMQEIIDLQRSVRRSGSGALLVVFGYATSVEMDGLNGWRLLQIAPPTGSTASALRPIPAVLNRYYSPLTRLFERPECREAYSPAGQDWLPRAAFLSHPEKWRRTFLAIREFIERNSNGVKIEKLASAWATRVNGRMRQEAQRLLYDSGLFFPGLRDLNGRVSDLQVGGPVAGAVSAYLDGIVLSLTDRRTGVGEQLFRRTLESARSGRRLPLDLLPDLEQLTNWLALLVGVHEASDKSAVAIINDVAAVDANIALDLHGIRTQVTGARPSAEDVVYRFLEHSRTHGNAVPLAFPGPLDQYVHPQAPLVSVRPDVVSAHALIKAMPDLEVLSSVLASCAIVAESTLVSLWDAVVPPGVRQHLKSVGAKLRQDAIEIPNGRSSQHVYASARPVTLADVEAVFPGISRSHRQGERASLLPWLSAYLVAFGCGGGLPTVDQFRVIANHPRVREEMISDTTRSSIMLPRHGAEWLVSISPPAPVRGNEFVGERPSLFDRRVGKANWQQPEFQEKAVFADVPSGELTARPDREKLAACRVVFRK